jgi:hypothetical protein
VDVLLASPVPAVELLTAGFAVAVVVDGFVAPGAIEVRDLTGVVFDSVVAVREGKVESLELVDEANPGFFSALVAVVVPAFGARLVRPADAAVDPVIRLDMPFAAAFFFSSPDV